MSMVGWNRFLVNVSFTFLEVWVLNFDFLWIRPCFIQEEETARLIFRLLDPDGHDYKPRAMSAGEAVSALSRPQPDAWLLAA